MKIKTYKLTGRTLDWAVAKCLGEQVRLIKGQLETLWTDKGWKPSTEWSQGGSIIATKIDCIRKRSKVEEASLAYPNENFKFKAEIFADISDYYCGHGPTPLIAAMRCYVASTLGDEVDVPDELVQQNHENPTNP